MNLNRGICNNFSDFMIDFFKFENDGFDVPFYNGIPKLSKLEWIILMIAEFLFVAPVIFPIRLSELVFPFYMCLVVLIPVLYLSRGDLGLFFKKIRRSDIKLIIFCVIAPFVYSMMMLYIIEYFKLAPVTLVEETPTTIINVISMIVQLMGEELFKIVLLILVMALVYHFSKNRKLSIVLSAIVTMLAFGSLHGGAYGTLVQVLLVQGLGSIFDLYAYLKTKNVLVSYTAHLLFDFIPFAMEILLLIL